MSQAADPSSVDERRDPDYVVTVDQRTDTPGMVRTGILLLVVALLALVGLLNYVTGPWLSFALFYVSPVLLAAWWLGRGPALVAGVTAGGRLVCAGGAGDPRGARRGAFWDRPAPGRGLRGVGGPGWRCPPVPARPEGPPA